MSRKRKSNRSRCWCFTFNNPPDNHWTQLINKFKELKLEYVFQLEKGEGETIHFQGVIRYEHPRENWPEVNDKIHWERCRSWKKSILYCSKKLTRINGPWSNVPGFTFRRKLLDPLAEAKLYDWQIDVKKLALNPEIEFRKIYWWFDSSGNIGKTSLGRHLKAEMGDSLLYCNGLNRDILYSHFDLEHSLGNRYLHYPECH